MALVNKTAVNKLEEFESLISQRPELLQKCIIFVQTMEYGAKLQEILVRYSDKYHTYYADDEKINLENFAAGKIDCLLTCKKFPRELISAASRTLSCFLLTVPGS